MSFAQCPCCLKPCGCCPERFQEDRSIPPIYPATLMLDWSEAAVASQAPYPIIMTKSPTFSTPCEPFYGSGQDGGGVDENCDDLPLIDPMFCLLWSVQCRISHVNPVTLVPDEWQWFLTIGVATCGNCNNIGTIVAGFAQNVICTKDLKLRVTFNTSIGTVTVYEA